MQTILKQQVARGARLYTDEYFIYHPARSWGFRHRRVQHSKRFTRGHTHTQGIEGYWGHLKPVLVARHRSISPKYLQRYLTEADAKHNLGLKTDFTALILAQLVTTRTVLPSK